MIAWVAEGATARVEAGHRDVARNEAGPVCLGVKGAVHGVRLDEREQPRRGRTRMTPLACLVR